MNTNFFYVWFRILCFSAFIGMAFRFFKKKLAPQLKSLYYAYKKSITDKIKNHEQLQEKKKSLLNEILVQQQRAAYLSHKIKIWQEKEKIHTTQQDKEGQHSKERLRHYMIEQSHFFGVGAVRKKLMPEICKQVKEKVTALYSHSDQQSKYMTSLFNQLRKTYNE